MRKILVFIICAALAVCVIPLSLGGCRRSEDVSVLYYTYSDAYISSVRSAMDAALRRAGLSYHNYDAGSNQTTQTEQVDTAITKGTKLLLVNIVDTGSEDAARAIIEKARTADIPLIFFNRSVDEKIIESYDKCVFVGTDYEAAGHMQGKMIGDYLVDSFDKIDINGDGKISYVLFKGQQGNAEAEARTKYAVLDANAILAAANKPALSFYDSQNKNGYLLDQDGNWSNAAANNYMKTILSGYSEQRGNMVELVIANNDEMALGALSALEEAGYNREGGRYIPVFGIDATEAARAKIASGAMAGTVVQDGAAMAECMVKIASNFLGGMAALDGISEDMIAGRARVNIPYSLYTSGEKTEK
ncbi:MAG: galactose ABC transporter substrate-binding protein [Clostridia bacterium]|nr:galactose ABC transporter substrate-binding protein [Clostridia bacterium]